MTPGPRRSRAGVGLLVLAALTVLTLDARRGEGSSPLDLVRSAVASVLGPAQDGATMALRPLTDIPQHFEDLGELRDRNEVLEAKNDQLIQQLRVSGLNQQRAEDLVGVRRLAGAKDFDLVRAEVVGLGAAQSFSQTVTIDAGTRDGVRPDLTVVNADGLVGRVVEATAETSTVLLIIDSGSTVGGRLGESMELGFVAGDGDVSDSARLELSLVDHTVSPREGDVVVTWGSRGGAPYVAGVPIGQVESVHSSPSELTQTADIRPYVDFSALDVVAVVTDSADMTTRDTAGGPR
ncbi:MAG: rod shape-determining protein MreC [Nocardioidaceae bacterium]|nr:rod shape-determining protein MreC [Nocardioidaceae bacterium]